MILIICADPLNPRQPDSAFAAEAEAATRAGFTLALLTYERLVHDQDAAGALGRLPPRATPEACLYRGWMLRVDRYTALYDALAARGYQLLQTPAAYRSCHELPAAYPSIRDHTPATVWLPREAGLGLEQIMAALRPFGAQPVLVKDYVKSRKHEWAEACFIPSAADRDAVARVTGRFLELQGDELQGGLVFRAFEPLRTAGTHPQSGMPLAIEYRAVIFDRRPLCVAPYWEGAIAAAPPDLAPFADVIAGIPSRFFTLDLAQRADGRWRIIELGDGQVAGLPPGVGVDTFYVALSRGISG
ncbi:ATP-grasp domain-containing protein [Oscillochloris sp. ZM17-4]|uniref:ATP-grasp domain-containing protein n=1 Tax=Oscillochloris sp. ZM17-4 TaxID=2866714 RepID=UPI001C730520|nr:ATP-grasp domain-containing protein [Oscillochloris sp. ZM17-4]MBX0329658.1 ATP-grasp domain-containing protein [Oscillochloris sp. ZM17-4]